MREIVALLVFFLFSCPAVYFALKGRIGISLTATLLIFALVSGLAIVNYDWFFRVKWEVPGLEPFKQQVAEAKTEAMESLRREYEERIQAMDSCILTLSEAQERVDGGAKTAESLLQSIDKTAADIRALQQKLNEVNEKSERTRDQIIAIHGASTQLALLLTKVLWLQFEADETYGAERAKAAVEKLMDGLDEVVNVAIEDPKAKSEFIESVKNSLPPRP